MDKKTISAFIAIGLIFLLWMSPWYQKTVVGVTPVPADSTAAAMMSEPVNESLPAVPVAVPERSSITALPKADRAEETLTIIRNSRVEATLSSRGGGTLISWKLVEKEAEDTAEYKYKISIAENEPIEMIPGEAEGNLAITTDRGLDFGRLVFQLVSHTQREDGTEALEYAYTMPDGARLVRTFTLKPDEYHLNMTIRFAGFDWEQIGEKFMVLWNSGLNPTEPDIKKNDGTYYEAMALQGKELTKQKKKGSTGYTDGNTNWVSIRTKYFMMSMIPEETGVGANLTAEDREAWKLMKTELGLPWNGLQEESHALKIFLGPMDYQLLKGYEAELEKSMSWGWSLFKPLSIGALYALQYLYSKIHNFGWAIIIFGIFIKLILYPLTRHSYKSMKEMQALQPKMAALKEKHKSDPQKLNEETMKLYKTHGVNPMGGCLPMVLQMPVLFALFNLFRSTIMLRHAEFLMIKDLSAPDHILGAVNVLPLLMGVSMIVQQRLSSASTNPQQKMMAYMMPIMFLFLFYNFSSGLNLYYLIFNVFTIAQELIIKKSKPEPAAE